MEISKASVSDDRLINHITIRSKDDYLVIKILGKITWEKKGNNLNINCIEENLFEDKEAIDLANSLVDEGELK